MSNFKIASWNVNSLKVRLPHVIDWLTEQTPDVLALQETKSTDDNFPLEDILSTGYQVHYIGQKTYNGVAILTKDDAELIAKEIPDYDDVQRRVIAIKTQGITVLNLYVPNGSEVDSEKYEYKMDWFKHLHPFIAELKADNDKMIILGDFNIAPDERDVHDPEEWEGKVHVSPKEREQFTKLLEAGFHDSFRLFEQEDKLYSWWDYRAAGFRRNRGLRIDHVLLSDVLKESCKKSWIDKSPRKLERPSDHTPVIAELSLR